ncbi:hypothetical protein I4U23_031199 [Adineta vaga]|nr:hypothetical protein I4U23_031199 [Adineta vaga]
MADIINEIKYILLQICYIFSIICCIFTLIHLLLNKNLRSILHNHVLLILLIISTFDLLLNHPFTLVYLHIGEVLPSTNTFCLYWNFINSTLTISTYLTMSWASIERHILIFYSSIFTKYFHRIIFHYIPLFFFSFLYPILFNLIITFIYPCTNQFNYFSLFCGYICALKFYFIFINTCYYAKTTCQQNGQFQLERHILIFYSSIFTKLFSSNLFFIILPTTIVSIVQNCCLATFGNNVQGLYLSFMVRFLNIFMPFVCLSLLPEIWTKYLPQNNRIIPFRTRTNCT